MLQDKCFTNVHPISTFQNLRMNHSIQTTRLFRIAATSIVYLATHKLRPRFGYHFCHSTAFFGGKNLKIAITLPKQPCLLYKWIIETNPRKCNKAFPLTLSPSLSLSGKFVTYCKCCKNIISFYTKLKINRNFENPTCQEAESFNKTILNVSSQGPLS